MPFVAGSIIFPQFFSEYIVQSSAGNESKIFTVDILKNQICLIPKIKNGDIIPETNWIKNTSLDCKDAEMSPTGTLKCPDPYYSITKNITYYLPAKMPVSDKTSQIALLNPTLYSGNSNSFCVSIINPTLYMWLKFGYESIILEGTTSYNADTKNITQFTGGAMLQNNITETLDTNPLYKNAVLLYHLNNETLTDTLPDLNKDNSTAAYDYSTAKNNGTISGAIWNCTGAKLGNCAMRFDGNNDYVNVKSLDLTDYDLTHLSFSVWFNLPDLTAPTACGADCLVSQNSADDGWDGIGMDILTSSSDVLRFIMDTGATNIDGVISTFVPTINTWYHAVGVVDGTTAKLYVNGILIKTDTLGGAPTVSNAYNINIGSFTYSGATCAYNSGSIDEVAIWNRSLSADEILLLYNSTYPKYGQMRFDNLNLGTNDTLNLSIYNCTTTPTTNVSMQIGNGSLVNLTKNTNDCNVSDYNLTGISELTNTNLTLHFYGNESWTGTPKIFGNITLDGWISYVAPPSDIHLNITNLTILPNYPLSTSSLNCSAVYYGSLDVANISFRLYINGVEQSYNATASNITNSTIGYANDTILGGLSVGDKLICSASSSNGTYSSGWFNSTERNIYTCSGNQDVVAIEIFIVFLMLFFAYMAMNHSDENWPLRIFFLLLSVGAISVIIFTSALFATIVAPSNVCAGEIPLGSATNTQESIADILFSLADISYIIVGLFFVWVTFVIIMVLIRKFNEQFKKFKDSEFSDDDMDDDIFEEDDEDE